MQEKMQVKCHRNPSFTPRTKEGIGLFFIYKKNKIIFGKCLKLKPFDTRLKLGPFLRRLKLSNFLLLLCIIFYAA